MKGWRRFAQWFRRRKPIEFDESVNETTLLSRYGTVPLDAEIDETSAAEVIAKLLFLEAEFPGREVCLSIESPGGDATAALAIVDAMDRLTVPVATWCGSHCAGMAGLVLAAGRRSRREMHPEATVQLLELVFPVRDDMVRDGQAGLRLNAMVEASWTAHTGHPLSSIRSLQREQFVLDGRDAIALGVVDAIRGVIDA